MGVANGQDKAYHTMKGLRDMDLLKIDKPIRLIELFAGIGSQAKALQRLGADFEHYRICEFDKYAIKSYNAIHGTDFITSDITKITAEDLGIVDTDKYTYICCYSFPCQDLSLAGKQRLMAKGSGTRSSLLWEVERLLNECEELPQILLMENVTQVHGKKNKQHFDEWIAFLESKGYKNYWKDLNAKNFGIPQNRNRCFMVSVLGDYTYEFPKEFPLKLRLKDMLEDNVDEKFYLSDSQMSKIVNWNAKQRPFEKVNGNNSIVQTLTARGAGENHSGMVIYSSDIDETSNLEQEVRNLVADSPKVVAGIGEKKSNGGTQWYQQDRVYDGDGVAISVTTGFNPYYQVDGPKIQKVCQLDGTYDQSGRVYSADGISPTIMSNSHGKTSGGYMSPKVILEATEPFIVASRGRNPENPSDRTAGIYTEQRLEPNFSGCSNTLTTVQKDNYVAEPVIIQKYGDRGTNQYSVRDYAHTIPANPMSDRVQMVVEAQINVVGNYSPSGHDASRIVDTDGIAPTVKENHGTVTAITEPKERFYKQALETFEKNDCSAGDTIDAYNKKVNASGVSPTITTRPEGFKTAILPVVAEANSCLIQPKDRNYKTKNQPRETHIEMKNDGVSHALRTNAETMVVEPIVCEQRKDEGLRFFKGDYCGALRTIDACGDKRVLEPQIIREEPLEREGWHEYAKEVLSTEGLCRTLSTQSNNLATKIKEPCNLRIRKLTPKECWRLMGFDDADFEKAAAHNSNSQLYKQAGNSIVVNVLEEIFGEML